MTTPATTTPPPPDTSRRPFVATQAGLSLLAAAVFVVRGVRTAAGDGLPAGQSATTGAVIAGAVALLTVGAAALALRSTRLSAPPLAVVLVLELLVLDGYLSPPRLLAALPLIGALAIAVVPSPGSASPSSGRPAQARRVLTALAFLLLAPIGFFYLLTGLVAPAPDLFGAYALYAAFVAAAVWLSRRRSWWVLAVPPAAAGAWFLMLHLGETFWGWSA